MRCIRPRVQTKEAVRWRGARTIAVALGLVGARVAFFMMLPVSVTVPAKAGEWY